VLACLETYMISSAVKSCVMFWVWMSSWFRWTSFTSCPVICLKCVLFSWYFSGSFSKLYRWMICSAMFMLAWSLVEARMRIIGCSLWWLIEPGH